MHQPHAEPRRSLYFDYQVHAAAAPQAADPNETPVVVVGGGPIGLVTALGLAQQGVRCLLLTSELQVSHGSRAVVFTRRSLEILQQAGVASQVQALGLAWRHGNSFYRGQRVFRMEAPFPDDDRHAPLTNLQQPVLETLLLQAIERQPLIEVRWGHHVTDLRQAEGSSAAPVTLGVDTPHGPYEQPASWVVAADGARSSLRQLCGLKLEGAAYEGRFVIADIRIDLPLPTERLAFFDPDWNRGNTVLMHREPQGIWRVDYQLPPDETPEQALAPEALQTRIDAQLAMIGHGGTPWTLDWCSVYSARALTLPDYVHGRVVFAGDAAHLLPIFGVRGANTGFQDAQNLAWKLALVVRGLAGPALLPSYSHERVAAAREIIDEAGKSTRFMTPPTRGFRLLRDAVLSLSLTHDFVRPLYHWRTSRPHDYLDSPLNGGDALAAVDGVESQPGDTPWGPVLPSARTAPGTPVPNLRLGDDEHLLDHLCDGAFTVLSAMPLPALAPAIEAWGRRGLKVACFVHPSMARLGLGAPGSALLVRPDQHVAARGAAVGVSWLDHALTCALGGSTPC